MPDDQRAEVADYIRAHAGTPDGTVRAIAARFGCSKTTVGRIADQHGLSDAWSEATDRTAAATAARAAYVAAQRAALQEDLLDTAADLLDRLHDRVTHLNVVKAPGEFAGEYVEKTELPSGPGDWRQTMQAVQLASSQAVALAKLDNENTTTASVTGLLDAFMEDLQADREAREPGEQPPDGEP
ncbi:hypothetical protein Lesp02_70630 [Lentzea sp. NBRC 105346]|nr:hypothetical protein Lesp02_70630 [Lentzea sp. NBRC 105346]